MYKQNRNIFVQSQIIVLLSTAAQIEKKNKDRKSRQRKQQKNLFKKIDCKFYWEEAWLSNFL